jgi:hypothetical protein
MINFFRKPKCKIRYVEEAGAPAKTLIVTAKTIEQAKEQFRQFIGNKTVVKVSYSLLP